MKVVKRTHVSLPQHNFITHQAKFPAFVAGMGSGKTEGLIQRVLKLLWENKPNHIVGYYLPNYQLIKDSAYPRFIEKFESLKIGYILNKSEHTIVIPDVGKIIFRSLDRPEYIISYETGDAVIDELDVLPTNKAEFCFGRVLERNRQVKKAGGKINTVAIGTTPEGFKFVYNRWEKNKPSENYAIIKASTYSNERHLPADYIPNLIEHHPPKILEAYLNGEFVNFTSGTVYYEFDRMLNCSNERYLDKETLYIGMDFNVNNMHAVVNVKREENYHAIAEIQGLKDTPSIAYALQKRYPRSAIYVFPDASGGNTSSKSASVSDLSILRQAGFHVIANSRNPFVRDRVSCLNGAFRQKKYFVNIVLCPELTLCFEQQIYNKNGDPDKDGGLDHFLDAAGYFCYNRLPIQGSVRHQSIKIRG